MIYNQENVTVLRKRYRKVILVLTVLLGPVLLFWPARSLRSDNFVFYFPGAHQVVPLEVVGQTKYLPVLKVLNLVTKVGGWQERGTSVTVWFGNVHLNLRLDDKRVRVNQQTVTLQDPVRLSDGQWMVPVDFLTTVLPKFTHEQVSYQAGTNRILIGNVKTSSFTVRLDPLPNGARLTLQFTDPVTVTTEAKNGTWVMSLGEHPMEPLEQVYEFQNAYVRALRFDDAEGVPKLVLTPTGDGLNFYPVLAEGGKVLLADVLKPPPTVAEQAAPGAAQPAPGSTLAPAAGIEEAPAGQPGPPLPLVVLDAGHGGDDAGARGRDGVLERDLVAQLVSRVRLALLDTNRYRTLLTRLGNANPSLEQRELAANVARPFAFLTFHAGDLGAAAPRVAVYTYQPPFLDPGKSERPNTLLVPWTRIQLMHLDRSRQLAQMVQERLARISGVNADPPGEMPVRALRSVDAPALAIEIGSLTPETDAGPLSSTTFQQQIAAAIAQALADFQGRAPS